MTLPGIARLGKILSLMRAAAFSPFECRPRHALRNERHIAQVVEIEPLRIEAGSGRWQLQRSHRRNFAKCVLEPFAHAEWPDMLVHHRLQADDFRSSIHRRTRA